MGQRLKRLKQDYQNLRNATAARGVTDEQLPRYYSPYTAQELRSGLSVNGDRINERAIIERISEENSCLRIYNGLQRLAEHEAREGRRFLRICRGFYEQIERNETLGLGTPIPEQEKIILKGKRRRRRPKD